MLKKVLLSLAVIGFIYGQSFAVEKKPAPTPPPHKCVICGKVIVTRGPCPQITCPRPIPGPKPKPNPKPVPHPNPHPGPKPHPGPQPQ
ncbi:MAG: hypothetical protein ACPLW6_07755 [Desulfurella sp.]|uniref:hypothetical protein n=1 Tax=Desulfurella sp. TaxID=1962857 RepID=UPI003C738476